MIIDKQLIDDSVISQYKTNKEQNPDAQEVADFEAKVEGADNANRIVLYSNWDSLCGAKEMLDFYTNELGNLIKYKDAKKIIDRHAELNTYIKLVEQIEKTTHGSSFDFAPEYKLLHEAYDTLDEQVESEEIALGCLKANLESAKLDYIIAFMKETATTENANELERQINDVSLNINNLMIF